MLTISLEVLPINQTTPSKSSTTTTAGATTTTAGATTTTAGATLIKPNFYSNGFALNNDVIFGLERVDGPGNMTLWWCSLNNGLPPSTPNWKNMNLGNQGVANLPFYNLTAIYIFNNSLIINYYTGRKNNFVIPLLSNSTNSPSTTRNTTPNNTNTITTSTNSKSSNSNADNGSNGTTNPNTISTSTSSTLSNDSDSNTETNNNTTTTTASNTASNTTYDTTPGTTLNTTTTSSNTDPLNKNNNTNGGASGGSLGGLLNGLSTAAQNGIQTDVGVNGIIGNLGNKDNINDFMKDANLLGNNIYVSPMNNDQLYNPQAKLSQLGKITSSFFPMIKIAQ
jgi:hypothetical protein